MQNLQIDRAPGQEFERLRSQSVISRSGHGGRHTAPYAFTEQGVAMLSSVIRRHRAVQVNIAIMRTFVRLRRMLQSNAELATKLAALETKYDAQFGTVFQAIRELMTPPTAPRKRIGALATCEAARRPPPLRRPIAARRRRRAPPDAS